MLQNPSTFTLSNEFDAMFTRVNSLLNVVWQIPGPGAHKIVDLDVYKLRLPSYSMTAKHPPLGDRTQKPGPGSHYPEKVSLISFCKFYNDCEIFVVSACTKFH